MAALRSPPWLPSPHWHRCCCLLLLLAAAAAPAALLLLRLSCLCVYRDRKREDKIESRRSGSMRADWRKLATFLEPTGGPLTAQLERSIPILTAMKPEQGLFPSRFSDMPINGGEEEEDDELLMDLESAERITELEPEPAKVKP